MKGNAMNEAETISEVEDLPFGVGLPPIILDRSTLERWGVVCPHQEWHISHGGVSTGSTETVIGDEVHKILSEACRMRQQDGEQLRGLVDYMDAAAQVSRPDVQPQVIAAMKRASWTVARMLCEQPNGSGRHPDDLIAYDGGSDDRSGQLAADLIPADDDRGPVRLTSELDLLLATASAEELDWWDWKSGWTWWTASDVREAFQFQFHAWLIFYRFPGVQRVNCRVFMTREALATSPVTFSRDRDFWPIHKRLMTATGIYLKYRDEASAADVAAWPTPEKCAICPAASRCSLASRPAADVAADPASALLQYVAVQAAADQLKANLTTFVRKLGQDLETGTVAFGANRPKAQRAPILDVYEVGNRSK
jgi:hypothetical protein